MVAAQASHWSVVTHSSLPSSSAVGRLRQSKLSILASREVSCGESSGGKRRSPLTTFRKSVFSVLPLKGKLPTTIRQRMIPSDQMSAGFPKYPSRWITSGAMQCGVPQKSQSMKVSRGSWRLKPQSISFSLPSRPTRMFSILRSRCTISRPCRYSSTRPTCRATPRAAVSPAPVPSRTHSATDRFSHSSVTMWTASSVSMVSWQAGMQGCCTRRRMSISLYRLARRSSLTSADRWQAFTANFRPSRLRATRTTEQVPRPRMGPRRQSRRQSEKSSLVILLSERRRCGLSRESMLLSREKRGLGRRMRGKASRSAFSRLRSLQSSISWRVRRLRWVCSRSWSSLLELRMTRVSLPSRDLREKLALPLALVLILRMQGSFTGFPSSTSPVFNCDASVFRFSFFKRCGLFSLIKLLYRLGNCHTHPPTAHYSPILQRYTLIYFLIQMDSAGNGKESTPRRISSNQPNEAFASNQVKSTSSNALTFVPLNLLMQLTNLANIYFIIISVMQMIPSVSVTDGTPTTLVPLAVVMLAVLIKDAYEEFYRYLSDKQQNQREVEVLVGDRFVTRTWESLRVGEVIKIRKEDLIPCDTLIVKTSDPENRAFVETKGLDGETNLKLKQSFVANRPGRNVVNDETYKRSFEIEYSPPNRFFASFEGWAECEGKVPIDHANLILRGCTLKNVHEVIGICLYTGSDTKLVLNSVKFEPKKSKLMTEINKLVVEIFIYQVIIALVCSLFNTLLENSYHEFTKFVPMSNFWVTTGTWWLLMTYFIPISLMVTMEMIKLFQGATLDSDPDGFSPLYNCFTTANNTSVNENLGQIRYVFTDKTGTLTKNNMLFRYFVCNGTLYGDQEDEAEARNTPLDMRGSVRMYDARLRGMKNNEKVQEALKLICLCHDIYVESEDGKLTYNSSSPDEIALINFAKLQEKELLGEHNHMIEVAEGSGARRNVMKYEKLAFLEFNSVRKRMSVIVRDTQTKHIVLYTKGADSTVKELIRPGEKDLEATQKHIDELSVQGLRTLMLGKKRLSEEEYKKWNEEFVKAKSTIGEKKEEAVAKCYERIEKNLELVGATAIEDELQDDVVQTITDMRLAGMTFFILTGDKRETAVNIGRSCGLVDRDAILVDIPTYDSGDEHEWQLKIKKLNEIKEKKVFLLNAERVIPKILPTDQTICYRCTPANKKEIVERFKEKTSALTMAVGDGANDVNMITAADVGIGIRGKEGTEAARVADFVAGEFKFIRLLTLYYGREWYRKNADVANYSFFKNWYHVASVIAFGGYTYFSGVTIFNVYLYELFNVIYSSWPIIIWAVFDEEHTFKESQNSPALYSPGISNAFFNQTMFLKSVAFAVLFGVTSMLLLFNALQSGVLDSFGTVGDLKLSGSVLFGLIVIIINLKILVMATGIKPIILVLTLASIAVYWPSEAIYAALLDEPEFAYVDGQFVYATAVFSSLILVFFFVLIEFGYRKWQEFSYQYEKMKEVKQIQGDLFQYILKSNNT